jgi:hypothetical protein
MSNNTTESSAPDNQEAPQEKPQLKQEEIEEALKAREELAAIKAQLREDQLKAAEKVKQQQEEAAKNGELKTAYELAQARLKELESVAPLAERWKAYEAQRSKELEEEATALPDSFKSLFVKAVSIEDKQEVLKAFRSIPGMKQVESPPDLGSPPSQSNIDFDEALKDEKKLAEAKQRDPKGFAAWFAGKMRGNQNSQPLGVQRFVPKQSAK